MPTDRRAIRRPAAASRRATRSPGASNSRPRHRGVGVGRASASYRRVERRSDGGRAALRVGGRARPAGASFASVAGQRPVAPIAARRAGGVPASSARSASRLRRRARPRPRSPPAARQRRPAAAARCDHEQLRTERPAAVCAAAAIACRRRMPRCARPTDGGQPVAAEPRSAARLQHRGRTGLLPEAAPTTSIGTATILRRRRQPAAGLTA